jgi:hypothetical protein
MDLARGAPSRLTFGPSWNYAAYWSPDGAHWVQSQTNPTASSNALVLRDANGKFEKQLVDAGLVNPSDWSTDGRYIVYTAIGSGTNADLWLIPQYGDQKPAPYLRTQFLEGWGRVSPDGRWMAYASNESGTPEVYISAFPEPGAKWRVSTKGGGFPKWRADGKELFYLAPDQTLMAVAIRGAPDQAGTPETLFTTPIVEYGGRINYAPSADGKRFLINARLKAGPHTIHVITGWTPGTR